MSIQKTTPWIHYSYKFQLRGMLKCQETHLIHHLSMNKLLLLLPIQISEECLYGTDAFDAYQLPLPDPKKWEFCVLSTTYFFIYLWQHNLVFKKFLEVTWNNLNNKTPPYHHDTVTLQVPKPKFTDTKRLSTQLPPLLYYHGVHYNCHTATVPSILLLPSFPPPSQYQLTTITNQHCFNKTRKRPVQRTFNHGYRKLLPTPAKDNKIFF